MPLWRIFSNPSTFTPDQKQALVESITLLYTRIGLPAFYVNVIFVPVESDCFYVGNQQVTKMVRIVIEHMAIHQPKEESDVRGLRAKLCTRIDELLAPHIAARGDLSWEYNIVEPSSDLWKIQGIKPPPFRSDAEKLWARENVPSAWEHGEQKVRTNGNYKFRE